MGFTNNKRMNEKCMKNSDFYTQFGVKSHMDVACVVRNLYTFLKKGCN